MVTTSNSYIHEYSFFDDVFDCLNESVKDVTVAMGWYNIKKHQLESKMMFESSSDVDYKVLLEKEGEGVLAKIGNAVMSIINKITAFIKKFTDKITGNMKLGKSDEEKVNQILAQHPELKNQVVEGIDKEWFTVADVAKFEKDVVGLIQMLNKNAIDHQTFMDKFKAKCKAFTDSAAPILGATTTVIGFMKILPEIHKAAKGTKDAISAFRGTCEKFKDDVDRNYSENDANKAQAIMNALSQAIGLTTKECQRSANMQSRWSSWASKFCNSALGKAMHADDASRDKRHNAAYDRRQQETERMAKDASIKRRTEDVRRDRIKQNNPNVDDNDLNATGRVGQRTPDEKKGKNNP